MKWENKIDQVVANGHALEVRSEGHRFQRTGDEAVAQTCLMPRQGIWDTCWKNKEQKKHKPKEAMGKLIPDKKPVQDSKPSSLRLDLIRSSFPIIVCDPIHSHLFLQIWAPQGISAMQVMELRSQFLFPCWIPTRHQSLCPGLGPSLTEGVQPHSQGSPPFLQGSLPAGSHTTL